MDAGNQTGINATRLKGLRRALIASAIIAFAIAVPCLLCWCAPSPIVSATHLGGDRFSLTNLTSEGVSAVLNIETNRDGQWIIAKTARYVLSPHEEFQSHVTSTGASLPSCQWRLHGHALKPAHGLSAFVLRVKLYVTHRNHLVKGKHINPFDSTLSVSTEGPDFFAYSVADKDIDAAKK